MSDQLFTSMSPAGNWHTAGSGSGSPDAVGYYIHRNRVHLQGCLYNYDPHTFTFPGVTTTLLTGIANPPAVDTAVMLTADLQATQDPATPGVTASLSFFATATAAGALVLASLPPYVNTAPNGSLMTIWYNQIFPGFPIPEFDNPLTYGIVISGASWDLGPVVDTPTPLSLAPFLDATNWEDVDSTIAQHGARIDLGGHIRAKVNGPQQIATLPHADVASVGGASVSSGSGSYTLASGPSHRFALRVDGFGNLVLDEDTPAPLDPPLTNPLRGLQDNLTAGLTFVHPPAGTRTFRNQSDGTDKRRASVTTFSQIMAFDLGIYTCGYNFLFGPGHCDAGGPFPTSEFSYIADQVASYNPAPDWIAIWVQLHGGDGAGDSQPFFGKYHLTCDSGEFDETVCGARSAAMPLQITATPTCDFLTRNPAGGPPYWISQSGAAVGNVIAEDDSGWRTDFSGAWLQQSGGVPEYTKDPNNVVSSLLFRPDAISTIAATMSGDLHRGWFSMFVDVWALYESRDNWILAGDELDLTGAGWQANFAIPPDGPVGLTPGNVAAAPGQEGIVRRGRISGSGGQNAQVQGVPLP